MRSFLFLVSYFLLSYTGSFVEGQDNKRVIIVGGGLAGLSAARRLKENSIDFVLLEGRNRLGGRIQTVEVSQDQPSTVDLGAAWLDGVPFNTVFDLAVEAGLDVVPQNYFEFEDHRIFNANNDFEFMTFFEMALSLMCIFFIISRFSWFECSQGTSIADRLDYLEYEEASNTRKILEARLEFANGARVSDINGNYYLSESNGYENGEDVMIIGGTAQLVDYLSQLFSEDEIILNQEVVGVTVEDDNLDSIVRIDTSEGDSYVGSHVIITVPLGVLKTDMITFSPPLSNAKEDAISRIGFGVIEKIVLTFQNAFWRKDPNWHTNIIYLTNERPSRFSYFVDCSDTAGSPTILTVVVAEMAQQLIDDPDVFIEEMKDVLKSMYPDDYETPVDSATTTWQSDQYARGTYTFLSTATLPGDIEMLAEPEHSEKVLFAGESTHKLFYGYLEGAMRSGQREADRVIAS